MSSEPTPAARKRLGSLIRAARKRQPRYQDIEEWAHAVKRSTRTVRGMERGEKVSGDTLDNVEQALNWFHGATHFALLGQPPQFWEGEYDSWAQALLDGVPGASTPYRVTQDGARHLTVLAEQNIRELLRVASMQAERLRREGREVDADMLLRDAEEVGRSLRETVGRAVNDERFGLGLETDAKVVTAVAETAEIHPPESAEPDAGTPPGSQPAPGRG